MFLDHESRDAARELLREHLCLDFLNPVQAHGIDDYFLSSYVRLLDWGVAVGTLDSADARALDPQRKPAGKKASAVMSYASALRRQLRALVGAVTSEGQTAADLDQVNDAFEKAIHRRTLTMEDGRLAWRWHTGGDPGAMLWPVVPAAIDLLMSSRISRLRRCEGCGWFFLDTSRNLSRRWCRMKDCGNRAKARSHRARGRSPDAAP